MVSGENIEIIIKVLNVKQKDLKCEGVQNISRLIHSKDVDLSPHAIKNLVQKIKTLALEKGVILPFPINEDVIKGKVSLYNDDLLNKIDNGENQDLILKEINQKLLSLNNDNSIKFLKTVISRMKLKKYKNAFLMSECCYKMIQLQLNKEERLWVYRNLIVATLILGDYKTVISLCKIIEKDIIESQDEDLKESFYTNFSLAYSKVESVRECEEVLKKVKSYTKLEKELAFLTTSAKCSVLSGRYDEAEKINLNILSRSKNKFLYNYTVNSCSNLSDIYVYRNDLHTARMYINKALEYTEFDISDVYMYNLYLNYMILEIESGSSVEKVEELFFIALKYAIKINEALSQEKLIRKIMKFYEKSNNINRIENTLTLIKELNVEVKPELLMAIFKILDDKEKMYNLLKQYRYDII